MRRGHVSLGLGRGVGLTRSLEAYAGRGRSHLDAARDVGREWQPAREARKAVEQLVGHVIEKRVRHAILPLPHGGAGLAASA
jgi:hypothetical protein